MTNAQGPPDGGTDTADTFPHQLSILLYESSIFANNGDASDGVIIAFDTEGNNEIDDDDALNNDLIDENVAIINNGIYLGLEKRNIPQDQEEIQLDINSYLGSNYVLVAEGIDMLGAIPYLYDDYTSTYTEIPQDGVLEYSYSIDENITESQARERFSIQFGTTALSIDANYLGEILLFPNPTNIGKFYLQVPVGVDTIEVEIYDIQGSRLYSITKHVTESRISIETDSKFAAGMYIVSLKYGGKKVVKKLIIH
ncbi:MAG: T9SS type A sorting domain-containing protein [Winogradskyella sp.]|nr:T9SS type A sorting domain-containing protein [Winogradskyella sp.]